MPSLRKEIRDFSAIWNASRTIKTKRHVSQLQIPGKDQDILEVY